MVGEKDQLFVRKFPDFSGSSFWWEQYERENYEEEEEDV